MQIIYITPISSLQKFYWVSFLILKGKNINGVCFQVKIPLSENCFQILHFLNLDYSFLHGVHKLRIYQIKEDKKVFKGRNRLDMVVKLKVQYCREKF